MGSLRHVPRTAMELVAALLVPCAVVFFITFSNLASAEDGGGAPDRVRPADSAAPPEGELSAELREQLENLGYIGATEVEGDDAKKVGVVRHKQGETDDGLAIYTPCGWGSRYREAGFGAPRREARLIDMSGKILHVWKNQQTGRDSRGWANSVIGTDGSLLVIHARSSLAKLDWESKVLWIRRERYHHDLDVDRDGTIVALVEATRTIEHRGKRVNILDNGLAFVTPNGDLVRTLWFYEGIGGEPLVRESLDGYFALLKRYGKQRQPRSFINRRKLSRLRYALRTADELGLHEFGGGIDIFHGNTVEILPSDPAGRWNAGDILTSLRNLNAIAVLDARTGALRWHWGPGVLYRQHDPSLLPNGNILIFDNQRKSRGSRILELDLAREEVVWSYQGTDEEPFFSHMRGQSQRLKNGNVLIVSSQSSRAFEVNRNGEIVWEFFGHDLVSDHRVPFRMTRLEGEALEWVKTKLAEDAR